MVELLESDSVDRGKVYFESVASIVRFNGENKEGVRDGG